MTTESKKPSEYISANLPKARESILVSILDEASKRTGYEFTAEDRTEFEESQEGKQTKNAAEVAASLLLIVNCLDAEHERRAAFERDVLERLGKVELHDSVRRMSLKMQMGPICPKCLEPIVRGQGHNFGDSGVPQHNSCPALGDPA